MNKIAIRMSVALASVIVLNPPGLMAQEENEAAPEAVAAVTEAKL